MAQDIRSRVLEQRTMNGQRITFESILPQLGAAYRRGEIVPFIGAGMSRPACTGWEEFIIGLEQRAGGGADVQNSPKSSLDSRRSAPSSSDLIRRADQAVKILMTRGQDHFHRACREALISAGDGGNVPRQTVELGRISWPLVVTTNYDDWFASIACNRPRVLGRNVSDCQQVLSSLSTSTPPIVWAVQGFLGGQASPPFQIPPEKTKELSGQVVVGHHHYQRVINAEPHFRKAFADIFRRRSLLFLGSGLSEDYVINLFGEIQINYGPGNLPHYAMLSEEEAARHGAFLQSRLNVTPIVYADHAELPDLLAKFREACSASSLSRQPAGRVEEHYLLSGMPSPPARLVLRWGSLSAGGNAECVAFSVGRSGEHLCVGRQGREYLTREYPTVQEADWNFRRLGESVYQFRDESVFAVAARNEPTDTRDLRRVAPAVEELLVVASKLKKSMVATGLIAAGPQRKWHPIFSLIEMLKGARLGAARLGTECPSLTIAVLDPAVWFPLQARKINVDDVLSGSNVRFWAEIQPDGGESSRVLCVRPEGEKVAAVAHLFGFVQGEENWTVEVHPRPAPYESFRTLADGWEDDLNSIGVVHGSTILFRERMRT